MLKKQTRGRTSQAKEKPLRRTHKERRETTRRQLLEAAIECVHELGYAAATLSLIADRAGVTRGAVQHHFGARNDLFLAIVTDISDKLFAQSDMTSLRGKPLNECLARLTEQYWHVINSKHYIAAAQIMLGIAHDPKLSAQVYKVIRKAEMRLDSLWVEFFADQKLPAERVMAARHIVLATYRGLTIRRIYRKEDVDWNAERRLLLEMLERTFSY